MKYLIIFLSAIMLIACNPVDRHNHVSVGQRDSLKDIFPDNDLASILSGNDDFYLYTQSIEYGLNKVSRGDVVEWEGPDKRLSGSIMILTERTVDGEKCKLFTHSLKIDGTTFNGKAEACEDAQEGWVIEK